MMNLVIEAVVLALGLLVFSVLRITIYHVYGSLVFLTLATFVISKRIGITTAELGFASNFKKTLLPWTIVTLGLLLLLAVTKYFYPGGIFRGMLTDRNSVIFIIPFYVTLSSFMQEFVLRGYFFARVKPYMNLLTAIILNIIIFSLFHLPFLLHYQSGLFYLATIGGIVWSIFYAKYPNIYLAWLSHSLVGATTLLLLQKF